MCIATRMYLVAMLTQAWCLDQCNVRAISHDCCVYESIVCIEWIFIFLFEISVRGANWPRLINCSTAREYLSNTIFGADRTCRVYGIQYTKDIWRTCSPCYFDLLYCLLKANDDDIVLYGWKLRRNISSNVIGRHVLLLLLQLLCDKQEP